MLSFFFSEAANFIEVKILLHFGGGEMGVGGGGDNEDPHEYRSSQVLTAQHKVLDPPSSPPSS